MNAVWVAGGGNKNWFNSGVPDSPMMLFALILLIGIYPVVGVIVLFTDQSQLAHVDNRLEVRMTHMLFPEATTVYLDAIFVGHTHCVRSLMHAPRAEHHIIRIASATMHRQELTHHPREMS